IIAKGNEAGGWVSDETSFILLQRFVDGIRIPVWVQGGIGLHTVGACLAGGAAGVVLDDQLALARESVLPERVKSAVRRMDGSETLCLGEGLGLACRIYHRPGLPPVQELQKLSVRLTSESGPGSENFLSWQVAVEARTGWEDPQRCVWLLG